MSSKRTGDIRPQIVAVFLRHLVPLHRIRTLEGRQAVTLAQFRTAIKALL